MSGFIGLGIQGAGTTTAGASTDGLLQPQDSPLFPNGNAGAFDSTNKHLKIDSQGIRQGWTQTQQQVYLALFTEKGSCVVQDFGRDPFPLVIDDAFEFACRDIVNRALGDLIRRKRIKVLSVSVQTGDFGKARVQVIWKDMQTTTIQSLIV